MKTLKFVNIDSNNRPIFKDDLKNYYGSTYKLFPYETSGKEVLKTVTIDDITYFGNHFDCEPMGTSIDTKRLQL